jgi:hypothetical protein
MESRPDDGADGLAQMLRPGIARRKSLGDLAFGDEHQVHAF